MPTLDEISLSYMIIDVISSTVASGRFYSFILIMYLLTAIKLALQLIINVTINMI